MGSRIRKNVKHIFECYCEVSKPPNGSPFVSKKFPADYNIASLKTLPDFTYPCAFELSTTQFFSFVLTNIESKWMYGFCRHDPEIPYAAVILSYLPYHDTFCKLLQQIGKIFREQKKTVLEKLVVLSGEEEEDDGSKIYDEIEKLLTPLYSSTPSVLDHSLPKIPNNVNLTEYYSAIDTNGMIEILSALLFERRIIIRSRKPCRLSACVQAANDLLYPLVWQHIFIPILPSSLSEYLLAPMPFLIGVPESVLKNVDLSDIGDVVIVNADEHTVHSPFNDAESMPHDVISNLRKALKGPYLLDDIVSRAFLRTITNLVGSYKSAYRVENGFVTFDKDAFVCSRGSTMKPFLQKLVTAQTFQQFIEERIELTTTGCNRSDEFEKELYVFENSTKSGHSSHTLSDKLTDTLHLPSKFLRQVRDKTNPVVESAVESMKSGRRGVRSAYKDLRTRLENMSLRSDITHGSVRTRSRARRPRNFETIEELGSPSSNSDKLTQSANFDTNSDISNFNGNMPLTISQIGDNAEALCPLSPLLSNKSPIEKDIEDLIKLNDEPRPSITPSDVDLLQEYGLDVNRFRLSRGSWTTFD